MRHLAMLPVLLSLLATLRSGLRSRAELALENLALRLAAFRKRYPKAQTLLVGGEGVPLAELFGRPAVEWFA